MQNLSFSESSKGGQISVGIFTFVPFLKKQWNNFPDLINLNFVALSLPCFDLIKKGFFFLSRKKVRGAEILISVIWTNSSVHSSPTH